MRAKITPVARTIAALIPLVSILLFFTPAGSTLPAQSVADSSATDVRIGVLGLFHPHQFTVSAPAGSAVVLQVAETRIVLETSSGLDSATIRIAGGAIVVSVGGRELPAAKLTVTGRKNEPVDFVLVVPGRITRHYHGTLEIKPTSGNLTAIVAMDREAAVASVVAAENTPDTPFEALKAQAVAARSYFAAGRARHHDFDFCDTTHCQFLREAPAPGSTAARAAAATRDLVLAYDAHPFAAMYTRSCSGRTHTPAEVGLSETTYPYYSVECKYCRAHPARWSSRISAQDGATLHSSDESARLKIDRRLGWSAVPGNTFVATKEGGQVILEGTGEGHGIGLCQSGAAAMAVAGADFRQILSHYYPNTTVVNGPSPASRERRVAQISRLP